MSKELGTLVVVILKAKNLHDRHSFYKQDPYAKVALNGKTFKTDADPKGGQHPEWDAEFRFPVYSAKSDSSRQLEVACWRAEPREDEEIGKGKIDISDTLRTGEFDDWVTINDVTGTYKGELYLEMTFFAAGPPPLDRRPSKLPPQERLQHLKAPGKAPTAGGKLAAGGPYAHGTSPPRMDKPLPSVQVSQGPAPLPSILRPGTGVGIANGPGSRPDGYMSPINSKPPSSLFPSRPPTSPAQPNNTNPLKVPGKHSPNSSGTGYKPSYSPPRVGHSPPRPSYSPPRQPEYNPYVSNPAPPSNPGSAFFPSPKIVVDPTQHEPGSWNPFASGSGYSPTQPPTQVSKPPSPPISTYPGGPGFPSTSPHHPPSGFHPAQPTSPMYPPPQSAYPPPQPGYPQQQSTYQPTPQPEFPFQAPPQFPSHQSTYPVQHQSTYPAYGHVSPAPGPGQRQFFGRQGSIEEFPDPALMQRYSSPLPLPNDTRSGRSSSPFPIPSVSPPHPAANTYNPSAEYERELHRREQEERDAELARQLDMELNLRG